MTHPPGHVAFIRQRVWAGGSCPDASDYARSIISSRAGRGVLFSDASHAARLVIVVRELNGPHTRATTRSLSSRSSVQCYLAVCWTDLTFTQVYSTALHIHNLCNRDITYTNPIAYLRYEERTCINSSRRRNKRYSWHGFAPTDDATVVHFHHSAFS